MARFFADKIDGNAAIFIEDAGHMVRTLRLKTGDVITALDGQGQEAQATIVSARKEEVRAHLSPWHIAGGEPFVSVTVYQGLCKGERFETVVQKCTELGASAIVPLALSRCEVKGADMDKRIPRLLKIAREASKQSGRGRVPQICSTVNMEDVDARAHDLLLCPYEGTRDHGLLSVIGEHKSARSIGIVIGPEGGLTTPEVSYFLKQGAQTVTLGPRILRTETAAPAVLAVVMAILGQWDGELD